MKLRSLEKNALVTLVGLLVLTIAGCPTETALVAPSTWVPGYYWVEYAEGELVVTELPRLNTEAAKTFTVAMAEPDWYEGPALYEVADDGTWTIIARGYEEYDEFLNLYDPKRPLPEAPDAAGFAR